MAKILVIGCGDIGGAVANELATTGHDVTGLRRSVKVGVSEVSYVAADVTNEQSIAAMTFDFDQIIYILSPSAGNIAAYKAVFEVGVDNVLKALKKQCPNVGLTFVSSTRVYGQNKGEWLDEQSDAMPADERGRILLAAENKFLGFNNKTTIVRFSGIYGRSNYFLKQIQKGTAIQKKPAYYTNRIHKQDCVAVLVFMVKQKFEGVDMGGIYIASDHDPATKWDVAYYLADISGLHQPEPLNLPDDGDRNKRLNNQRLLDAGYEFKYKSYKQGYKEVSND